MVEAADPSAESGEPIEAGSQFLKRGSGIIISLNTFKCIILNGGSGTEF